MIEQASRPYCEVCGIDVKVDMNLKRFSKFFCSDERMQQYIRAKQSELGLNEDMRERRRMRFGC